MRMTMMIMMMIVVVVMLKSISSACLTLKPKSDRHQISPYNINALEKQSGHEN